MAAIGVVLALAAGIAALIARSLVEVRRHRRTLDALRQSEQRYKLLFQANPAPMWVCDEESRRFLAVNAAAVSLYGYSREEFAAMTMRDIRPPEELHQDQNGSPPASGTTCLTAAPQRHRRKDGTVVYAEVVSDVIRFADQRARLFMVHDVTRRLMLEAQLRQVQRMESIGMLAGGVAHDFNNILTAIGVHAELLHASLPGESMCREDLAGITAGVERAASLTRQLLAFGRLQMLHPVELDVNAVVREMQPMLSRLLSVDIALRLELADDLAPVMVDRTQLEQVLLNLIVNARDAMPDGGEIRIASACHELLADDRRAGLKPGSYVQLCVSDTGVGIPPDLQARIFEPFFTTKPSGKGTGLGLSTVYGIVKQSNGYIYVSSTPGSGTMFEVLLPTD